MNSPRHDELLARYAANDLLPDEWAELLDAAFKSQDVFDALTTEYMLRDLLDDPTSREILLAANKKIGKARRFLLRAMKRLPTGATKVFICYAKEDLRRADALFRRLSSEGFDPWMDKRCLILGDNWEHKMALRENSDKWPF